MGNNSSTNNTQEVKIEKARQPELKSNASPKADFTSEELKREEEAKKEEEEETSSISSIGNNNAKLSTPKTPTSIDSGSDFGDEGLKENTSFSDINLPISASKQSTVRGDLENFLSEHFARVDNFEVSVKISSKIKRRFRSDIPVYRLSCSESKNGFLTSVFEVERKFEELNILYKNLKDYFNGMFIPPLLKFLGDSSEMDKEFRSISAIKLFLKKVVANPFLFHERLFKDFITSKYPFSQQRASFLKTEESLGHEKWLDFLHLLRNPDLPVQLYKSLKMETILLLSHYRTIKKDLIQYLNSLESQKNSVNILKSQLDDWVGLESIKLPLLNGTLINADNEHISLAKTISDSSTAISGETLFFQRRIEKIKDLIQVDVNYEICQLEVFKRDLKAVKLALKGYVRCDHIVKNLQKQEMNKIEKLNIVRQVNSGTSSPTGNNFDRRLSNASETEADKVLSQIRLKLSAAQSAREEAAKVYQVVARGFLVAGLHRLRYDRFASNSAIIKELSNITRAFNASAKTTWDNCFNSIPLSPKTWSEIVILQQNDLISSKPDVTLDLEVSSPIVTATATGKVRKNYIAMFDFEAQEESERSMKKGEIFMAEDSAENPEWLWVINEGFVPASHVKLAEEIKPEENESIEENDLDETTPVPDQHLIAESNFPTSPNQAETESHIVESTEL